MQTNLPCSNDLRRGLDVLTGCLLMMTKIYLNEISRRVSDKTSMVFICNPNNPTGTMNSASDLEDFCLSSKKTCIC